MDELDNEWGRADGWWLWRVAASCGEFGPRPIRGLISQEHFMTSDGIRFAVIMPGEQTHLIFST
ncbi:hypothetical protein VI817_010286 [Penicillium citrinum]|nr:hypothetical protein VI817_010286 [Penicillium citrinum]